MSMSEGWLAGVARRCITPPKPIWLYGYMTGARFKPSEGVLDDLFVHAVALKWGTDDPALIVVLDLCVIRKPLAESIARRITEATGVPRERMLINLSHTHSGPALDQPDLEGRFPIPDDQRETIAEYTSWMQEKVAETALAALQDLHPASLACGWGETDIMCNRRRFDEDGHYERMGPNPDGPVDRAVPVLRINANDGKPFAVLFGCACHNVTLGPTNLMVSADYAGYARKAIEERFPGAEPVFIQGCGADSNPEPRGGDEQAALAKRHGEVLAEEVCRVLEGESSPVRGPLHCAMRTVNLPLRPDIPREELERMAELRGGQSYNAGRMLEALDRGEAMPEQYTAPFSIWRFDGDLTVVGLPGEVVCEYALRATAAIGKGRTWVAGYCHEVFGYLPSAQIVREGGYEMRGLLPPAIGYFSEDVEDEMARAINGLSGDLDGTA